MKFVILRLMDQCENKKTNTGIFRNRFSFNQSSEGHIYLRNERLYTGVWGLIGQIKEIFVVEDSISW